MVADLVPDSGLRLQEGNPTSAIFPGGFTRTKLSGVRKCPQQPKRLDKLANMPVSLSLFPPSNDCVSRMMDKGSRLVLWGLMMWYF